MDVKTNFYNRIHVKPSRSKLLYWEWEQCGDAGAAMPLLFEIRAWEGPGEPQF